MQLITNTIKTLFLSTDCNSILKGLFDTHHKSLDRCVDRSRFVHLLRVQSDAYSIDQLEGAFCILTSKWMKSEDSSSLKYADGDSVYNVLLHFCKDVLHLDNNAPVTRYEEILPWHIVSSYVGEDLLTTAYLASVDLRSGTIRHDFTWSPYISTDNASLSALLKKPVCDMHNHLKGSSLNIELSWMSLMNHIAGRRKEFGDLSIKLYPSLSVFDEEMESLTWYSLIIKAAAIRWYIYCRIHNALGVDDFDLLHRILTDNNELSLMSLCLTLQEKIDTIRHAYGRKYIDAKQNSAIPDYAINENQTGLFSLLSGERQFLYDVLRAIYNNDADSGLLSGLLYAYLCIKIQFRQEIVQTNDNLGFANFALYERRKDAFVPDESCYHSLVPQLAVGEFIKDKDGRYMETRIAPKDSLQKIVDQIQNTDKDIQNVGYDKDASGWNDYDYVYHFIKKEDKAIMKNELHCRHYILRAEVKQSAKAIFALRTSNTGEPFTPLHQRVVGIDAANSEIYARPEIFAQAFRYLRNNIYSDTMIVPPTDLGMTYHVGEDYMDIVDGLRAVDEVLSFLNFGNGDRFGHALVLGTEVARYYQQRDMSIAMSKQMILDNVAWLYVKCGETGNNKIMHELNVLFEKYFREVYGSAEFHVPSVLTYYQSWLLRGDDPNRYYSDGTTDTSANNSADPWERASFVDSHLVNDARKNQVACRLYYLYHFDMDIKKNGGVFDVFRITPNIVSVVEDVQQYMLNMVEQKHISIECNPTSNYRIGEMTRYDEHPILKFYNDGINVPYDRHSLTVSINTDDKGVFSTSLEREYALMAAALEKRNDKEHSNSPKSIIRWLNDIREMSWEQKFY